jgi:hypothetical protein
MVCSIQTSVRVRPLKLCGSDNGKKHNTYSPQFKAKVALTAIQNDETTSQIAIGSVARLLLLGDYHFFFWKIF